MLLSTLGVVQNIRRNLSDEVDSNGIIDTLSWVSQSLADWTVPQVHHPRPEDVALNYYSQAYHNYDNVGSFIHGHSSSKYSSNNINNIKYLAGSKTLKPRYTSSDRRKTIQRPHRPPLTAKRKSMPKERRRKPFLPSYQFDDKFFQKKTLFQPSIMPSQSYSFPTSRQDPSMKSLSEKHNSEQTIVEYVMGKVHNVFG